MQVMNGKINVYDMYHSDALSARPAGTTNPLVRAFDAFRQTWSECVDLTAHRVGQHDLCARVDRQQHTGASDQCDYAFYE